MSDPSSICVLVSGGLDSDVLLAEAAQKYRQVYPVYVRQGLAWEKIELFWLRRFLIRLHQKHIAPLRIVDLPMDDLYGEHWSTSGKKVPGRRSPDSAVYLPGRNLTLSVKAAVFCAMNGIRQLALGSLGHNPFPDASPKFFAAWGKALGQGLGKPLKIVAPYRQLSKTAVIKRGARWPLELSFSCIAPKGNCHCGRCNKCEERRRAFKAAGVQDKTIYAKR